MYPQHYHRRARASLCTCSIPLQPQEYPDDLMALARFEIREAGLAQYETVVLPWPDRAAIEIAPAISWGDNVALAAGMATSERGYYSCAPQVRPPPNVPRSLPPLRRYCKRSARSLPQCWARKFSLSSAHNKHTPITAFGLHLSVIPCQPVAQAWDCGLVTKGSRLGGDHGKTRWQGPGVVNRWKRRRTGPSHNL